MGHREIAALMSTISAAMAGKIGLKPRVNVIHSTPSGFLSGKRWWWAGALLVAVQLAILLLSARFGAERPLIERPVLLLVGLEILAGIVWLAALWPPVGIRSSWRSVLFMLAVGVILRGVMLPSTPILEDDFWRYLWDGAVVARGHSPYTHAPQEFLADDESTDAHLSAIQPLVRDGQTTLARINHPTLRTLYPPLAQAAFALAHWISPWSLVGWRMVLLLFDAGTLALLLLLLRRLKLPSHWAAIYWWNPLLVQQSVNAAHMDVLALPFVLGALLLTLQARPGWGIALMSAAAGVKLWPLILLPFLFRPLVSTPRRLAFAIAVAAGILALLIWSTVHGVLGDGSGFAAYAKHWEMNDALFMALLYGIRMALGWFGSPDLAPAVARILALGLLTVWVAGLAWRPITSAADMAERMLLAVAGLFLLSPTQFPWYSLWMLPLLALRPRLSLLLLTALLPLFHLRFYFDARNHVAIFDSGIVWLEYAPVWGLLVWEAIGTYRRRGRPSAFNGALGKEWRTA